MCGIAGFISPELQQEDLYTLTRTLKHRGPDAEGFFLEEYNPLRTGLGHRRLSIIDLSEAANQPMYSHCGRYVMVFNGEIYNYSDIKQQKLPGVNWRSSGDSEVILEAFARFGAASFAWLNGMFALAIWDKQTQVLTVARDHIGIKPFYYYLKGAEFIFSSELKGICSVKKQLPVNYSVIPAFLHVGYIPHPYTAYLDVHKLPAGSFAEISLDAKGQLQYRETSFWKIGDHIEQEVLSDESAAKKQLDELLTDAVARQLVSDVPIGTFLSGGTDSSIVTAMACKVAGRKINTYSIAVTDGKVNEAPYAAAVARHLHTNHHELPISQKDMLEMVPGFMQVYDEPFTDSSAFPTMLVSKLARQHVTVTLSGDGGDELFCGYGSYQWARRMQHPLLKLASPLIFAGTRLLNSRFQRAGGMFESYPKGHFNSHLFSQSQYFFSEKEIGKLLHSPAFDLSSLNYTFGGRSLNAAEQMSFWDLENYLKDDLLVKVDRASMQYGLETRVPLLDYRVVEFALNLGSSLKLQRGGTAKYLLKQVLYDYVPPSLLDRPKWGFSIPLGKWLKTDLKWMIDQYCNKAMVEKAGVVKYEAVRELVRRYQGGKADHLYNKIWTLIVLHWFLHEHQ
ncbi:MAG: asparagine synthase (glutamine-hydrolyzing) [Sphingobacteriales bacterium]|nr:asparagine synthase (glutamine-hydrolyzing) [Sphingobacteriales bacterium]